MKKFGTYDNVQPYQETPRLPANGYIIGILDADEKTESWGNVLEIKYDIEEGEYKNHFTNQYKNTQMEDKKYKGVYRLNIPKEDGTEQDQWTARKFKTDIMAIEASNPDYHWDWNEKSLIGKLVGAVFFEKEYEFEGKTGMFTALYSFKDIEAIRAGRFKIPAPKMLKRDTPAYEPIDETDLPF